MHPSRAFRGGVQIDPPRPDSRLGFMNTRMPKYLTFAWHVYLTARDGAECFYCGDFIAEGDGTLEHLIPAMPACDGCYLSAEWNLVRAHRDCNSIAGSNRIDRKFELRDYLRGHGGHSALCNIRARFKKTDPMQSLGTELVEGTARHRLLNSKRKRQVVKAWKRDPMTATIGELVPGLAGWRP